MAANKSESPGTGWFTRQQMAAVFDVSVDHFDDHYRRFAPQSAVKTSGRTLYFHARTILDGWLASQAGKRGATPDGEVDPLLMGGDSPGLERYRNAKADLTEMERDRILGSTVLKESILPHLCQYAARVRRAGETIERRWGPEPAAILNESVRGWEADVARLFEGVPESTETQSGGGDQPAASGGGGKPDPAPANAA